MTGPTVTAAAIYVTSTTQISLTAVDGGPVPVGLAKIEASTDGIAWAANTVPIVLTGADGLRTVYYRARDRLGNMETARVLVLFLDNTAPTTAIAIPDGPLSIASRFSLSAADSGSGVDRIEYRIDGGAWRPYESPFAVPIGAHTIGYRAADRLGNLEPERVATIRVENWKPMIAVLLSIILAILAALLSLRARKVEGSRWKPVLVGGVVFAVAELATGVLSALTGAIPIPPFLDLGTIIDGSLVVVGLVVTSLLYVRANPRRPAT